MLASLLRPKARRAQVDQTPFSSPFTPSDSSPWFRAAAQRGPRRARGVEQSDDEMPGPLEEIDEDVEEDWIGQEEEEDDDGPIESTPLLPMFSASHLGSFSLRVAVFVQGH